MQGTRISSRLTWPFKLICTLFTLFFIASMIISIWPGLKSAPDWKSFTSASFMALLFATMTCLLWRLAANRVEETEYALHVAGGGPRLSVAWSNIQSVEFSPSMGYYNPLIAGYIFVHLVSKQDGVRIIRFMPPWRLFKRDNARRLADRLDHKAAQARQAVRARKTTAAHAPLNPSTQLTRAAHHGSQNRSRVTLDSASDQS